MKLLAKEIYEAKFAGMSAEEFESVDIQKEIQEYIIDVHGNALSDIIIDLFNSHVAREIIEEVIDEDPYNDSNNIELFLGCWGCVSHTGEDCNTHERHECYVTSILRKLQRMDLPATHENVKKVLDEC